MNQQRFQLSSDRSGKVFGPGRFAMMIDGENLHQAIRVIGTDIDFRKLLGLFSGQSLLICAMYHAIGAGSAQVGRRALWDWLEYNGYRVREKRRKSITWNSNPSRVREAGVSLEMAIDAMDVSPRIDNLVMFSGDGDLAPVVQAMQRRGIFVTAVSTLASKPHLIADRLRRQVDRFVDLRDLMPHLYLQRNES